MNSAHNIVQLFSGNAHPIHNRLSMSRSPLSHSDSNAGGIVIRTRDKDGFWQDRIIIESELINKVIDIETHFDDVITNRKGGSDIEMPTPLVLSQIVIGLTFDEFLMSREARLPDAYSIDFEGEVAFMLGLGGEASITHFLAGPDQGSVYLYGQVNGLAGFEGGIGVSANLYYSNVPTVDFNKSILEGPEVGVQGSLAGVEVSTFRGIDLRMNPNGGFGIELYNGTSSGFSIGSDTAASISAYVGYAFILKKLH